jgi:hypothetical protein
MMRFDGGVRCVRRWFHALRRPKRSRQPHSGWIPAAVELLENRSLLSSTAGPALATAGPSWSDATNLTVSFAPDGTQVGGQTSALFSTMGNIANTAAWEQTILDAFQTWAASANLKIGVVADGGQPFGTPGATQGDPRFGDIRIGAAPLSANVVALAIPAAGSASGTWTGDIIFNSNVPFSSLNDLYAVALHEAGHVLGLPESTDPASPMFSGFTPGTVLLPTSADLAALQQLYGPPIASPGSNGNPSGNPDYSNLGGDDESLESDDDNPTTTQSPTATPPGTGGTSPSSTSSISSGASTIELAPSPGTVEGTKFNATGVLTGSRPVVTYRVEPAGLASGQPNVMTVTIQADQSGGIAPSVGILDEDGHPLAGQLLANGSGLYTLQIRGIVSGKEYFVRIGSSNVSAANATAAYRLDVNFSQATAPVTPSLSGTLGPGQSQQSFQLNVAQSGLFQFALGTNASSSGNNVAVELAVFDQSGNQVYQTVGTASATLSASPVMLQGTYFVRVSAASSTGSIPANLNFSVAASVLSDPIGPLPVDPTGAPPSAKSPVPPPFNWTNVVIAPRPAAPPPFVWVNTVPSKTAAAVPPKPYPPAAMP